MSSHPFRSCRPALICALALGLLALPAGARTTIKMASLVPDSSVWGKILKDMGAEWQEATDELRAALERRGLDYQIDEGGGVFYAPKIDIKLIDSLGREWQGPTHQVDLQAASRVLYLAKAPIALR